MKANFNDTVNILVKAYLNDTLAHGDCWACAVGNIVADKIGYKVVKKQNHLSCSWVGKLGLTGFPEWDNVFCTSMGEQDLFPEEYYGRAKKQIDSTGYSWKQLARIEFAFESADQGNSSDEWMFSGLMAVVDVLAEIHNVDLIQRESAKLLFVK